MRKWTIWFLVVVLLIPLWPANDRAKAQSGSSLVERFQDFMKNKDLNGTYTAEDFERDNRQLKREIDEYFQSLGFLLSRDGVAGEMKINYPLAAIKKVIVYGMPFDDPGDAPKAGNKHRYSGYTEDLTVFPNYDFPRDSKEVTPLLERKWIEEPWTKNIPRAEKTKWMNYETGDHADSANQDSHLEMSPKEWLKSTVNKYNNNSNLLEDLRWDVDKLYKHAVILSRPTEYSYGQIVLFHNRDGTVWYDDFLIPPLKSRYNISLRGSSLTPNNKGPEGSPLKLHTEVELSAYNSEPVRIKVWFRRLNGDIINSKEIELSREHPMEKVSIDWKRPGGGEKITVEAYAVNSSGQRDEKFQEAYEEDNVDYITLSAPVDVPDGPYEGFYPVSDLNKLRSQEDVRSYGGNPAFIQELSTGGKTVSSLSDLQSEPVWKDSKGNDIGPRSFFVNDGSRTYLKISSLASLSGAKLTSKLTAPAFKTEHKSEVTRTEQGACVTETECETIYYVTETFRLQSMGSYYSQNLAEFEVEQSRAPQISKFAVDPQGNLRISASAFGFPAGGLKADLILDYEANKAKLPEGLRTLDNPANPQGGYWRKMVLPAFASEKQPFIHELTSSDGAVITKGTEAKLKGGSSDELVISQEKLQQLFAYSEQLDLFRQSEAYQKAQGTEKHRLLKYMEGIGKDRPALSPGPHTLTLYVTDTFGRFDYITIRYSPVALHDGKAKPEFAYFQGKGAPTEFSHETANGRSGMNTYRDYAVHFDLTVPESIHKSGTTLERPGFLAAWATDFPAMRTGSQYKVGMSKDTAGALHAADTGDFNTFDADGSVKNVSDLVPANEAKVYSKFDPRDFYNPKLIQEEKNTSAQFKAFPRVIRSGQGLFTESSLEVRAVLEGPSEADNIRRMAELVSSVVEGGSGLQLSGAKDEELITSVTGPGKYGDLTNNLSEKNQKLVLQAGTVQSLIEASKPVTTSQTIIEDSRNRLQVQRTEFAFALPVWLEPAKGAFGGSNLNTKSYEWTGRGYRGFMIHPNTKDGFYTMRVEGSADLSKLDPSFAGRKLSLYSRLEPLVVLGSVFQDMWVDTSPTAPAQPGNVDSGSGWQWTD